MVDAVWSVTCTNELFDIVSTLYYYNIPTSRIVGKLYSVVSTIDHCLSLRSHANNC